MNMTYKDIIFDDFVNNTKEYNSYYVEMCSCCLDKHKDVLGNRIDDGHNAWGICSVKGCGNEADCYIDFDVNEVTFN